MTKTELIQLALSHLPLRQFIIDKIANKYDVEVVRIPVKHYILNPAELGWAGLENYVRQRDVRFNVNDVAQLCSEWSAICDPKHVSSYFDHIYKHEEIFKLEDKNIEEVENDLIDNDDDINNNLSNNDYSTDD